ncbi:MAG: tRNA (guanosine(46)-N7)-methyltransferase TrmB [Aeromicrobium erythreum]
MPEAAETGRDPATPEPFHRRTVSFTRRGGRLTERQQDAWDDVADQYVLDVPRHHASTSVAPDFRLDPAAVFGREAPLVVEIGSGRGEALVAAAEAEPDVDFLGLEVYVPGVAQTLVQLRHRQVPNVRLAVVDAAEALRTMLPEHCAREVRLWFPDPWHKARHHKRRFVTEDAVPLVLRVLEPGGVWRMATDWADYAEQMADVIAASPLVEGGRVERFAGRPVTKFEQKGLAVGREIHDLEARAARS